MLRLTRAQAREIDRRSIEQFHIPGIVLMENAARSAAAVAMGMVKGSGPILIVCGGGNNGGDGLAIARHLHNHSVEVSIHLAVDPSRYVGDARINWDVVRAMGLPLGWPDSPSFLIDALFGTGLDTTLRPDGIALIDRINRSNLPVLAIDLPSGLDCDTGRPLGACVRAMKTITFVAEKAGFANPESKQYIGEVIVGEIGCPRELIERVSTERGE